MSQAMTATRAPRMMLTPLGPLWIALCRSRSHRARSDLRHRCPARNRPSGCPNNHRSHLCTFRGAQRRPKSWPFRGAARPQWTRMGQLRPSLALCRSRRVATCRSHRRLPVFATVQPESAGGRNSRDFQVLPRLHWRRALRLRSRRRRSLRRRRKHESLRLGECESPRVGPSMMCCCAVVLLDGLEWPGHRRHWRLGACRGSGTEHDHCSSPGAALQAACLAVWSELHFFCHLR